MKANTRALLAVLLAAPGLSDGVPWRPDDVIPVTPLPGYPPALWACYRSGREHMLAALVRRGLLGRLQDARYFLTPAGVALSPEGGTGCVTP